MAIDMPGVSLEDVDFSFRALKMGYKILYLPSIAIHMESATKSTMPNFVANIARAEQEIIKRHLIDEKFFEYASKFPKQVEETEVEK